MTFNVDNDFGVNQPRHGDDGDFHGDVDMRRASIDNPNDPNFRRSEFWSFQNPSTPTLSKAQYAETVLRGGQESSGTGSTAFITSSSLRVSQAVGMLGLLGIGVRGAQLFAL